MHYQEIQIGKQEGNLQYNGYWASFDCDLLKNFSKGSLLHCTRNFETNCQDSLIGMGNKGETKYPMSDVVSGEHELVEAQNQQNLKEKMKDAITMLSEWEKQYLPVQLIIVPWDWKSRDKPK